MKNKVDDGLSKQHKREGSYVFLVVITIIILDFCGSCGVRRAFLPKRNDIMGKLLNASEENKSTLAQTAMDDYMSLTVLLDNVEKEKLEKRINKIEKVEECIEFIEIHLVYQKLYRAWLKILSKSEAIKLENEIKNCFDQEKVDERIKESLPKILRKQICNAHARSKLKVLKIKDLKDILFELKVGKPTDDTLEKVIDQKAKKKRTNTATEIIQEDGWGVKLPLRGSERKEFMRLVMQFSNSDQQQLRALFYKAEAQSIKNFLYVFNDGKVFNLNERIDLLGTLIYLYRCDTKLCVKMCNDPERLSTMEEFRIFNMRPNLHLLTKLRDALS